MADKQDDIAKRNEDRLAKPAPKEQDNLRKQYLSHIQKLEERIKDQDAALLNLQDQNDEIIEIQKKNQLFLEKIVKTQLTKRTVEEEEKEAYYEDRQADRESRKNKKSVIDSLWTTLNTPVSEIWDKVKSFSDDAPNWKLDAFINVAEKLSLFAVRGIGWLLDSTIGKFLSVFGAKSKFLSSFLVKVASSAWDVIRWVYDVAKKTIEFIWDKFVMLAKVGWKILSVAWEVLSTPVNIIYDIFKEVVMGIITNPLGLVALSVAFVYVLRYAISSWWPKIKDFVIDLAVGTWDWITNTISDFFFKGDKSKMNTFFINKKNAIFNWLKSVGSWIVKSYDEYIGKHIGLTSTDIMNYFSSKDNIFSNIWNKTKDFLLSLYNSNILDEIQMAWNVIKDIYYAFEYYVMESPYRPEERTYIENLTKENEERLSNFYSSALNSYAKAIIQQNLLETYLNNATLENRELKSLLSSTGNSILENIKSSNLINAGVFGMEKTKEMMDLLDTSLVNDVVEYIMRNKSTLKKEDLIAIQNTANVSMARLGHLGEISKEGDLDKLRNLLSLYNDKTDDDFTKQITTLFQNNDTKIKEMTLDLGNGIKQTIRSLEDTVNQGKVNFVAASYAVQKEDVEKLQSFVENKLQEILGKKVVSRSDMRAKLVKDYPDMSAEEIDRMIDRIYQAAIDEKNNPFHKSERGSVVKGPTTILVGEGNSPEIIVPLTPEGVNFVKDSMGDVLDKLDTDSTINKKEEVVNRVQKMTKMMPKKDIKMYDMKNISSTMVMIG